VFDDDDEELACSLMTIAAINSHCFFIIWYLCYLEAQVISSIGFECLTSDFQCLVCKPELRFSVLSCKPEAQIISSVGLSN
jgi:hypothetical protein